MLYTFNSEREAHVKSAFFSPNALCGPSSATAAIVQLWAAARRGGAGKGGGDNRVQGSVFMRPTAVSCCLSALWGRARHLPHITQQHSAPHHALLPAHP